MNKIHTFHVTFHDIEGQSSEGLINLEGSFPDVYPPERNKSQVNKERFHKSVNMYLYFQTSLVQNSDSHL